MKSSLNLNNIQNKSTKSESPRTSSAKKIFNYFLRFSYQSRESSRSLLAILVLISLAAGLAIFQIQATAQIPGLAIKLTDSRQQSAEVAFKSRVLAADLAIELVKANDEAYRLSKSIEISQKTDRVRSQIILNENSSRSTFRQIFPRQYLPPEVTESMVRIEKSGRVE